MTGSAGLLMLYGVILAEELFIALYFFRFWRDTRETLFAFLSAGFLLMAVHRLLLGFAVSNEVRLEQQTSFFLVRLLSYVLILTGVIVKNRRRRG